MGVHSLIGYLSGRVVLIWVEVFKLERAGS